MNQEQKNSPVVHISIINWKRWRDTIECIDSLLRQNYTNIKIYIIDNASGDESVEKFTAYCEGKLHIDQPNNKEIVNSIGHNSIPPTYRIVEEANWTLELFNQNPTIITILKNTKNYGFGFAHNQILRFIATREHDFSWILNNDTIIPAETLQVLIQGLNNTPKTFATPLLAYYDEPSLLQCNGTANFLPYFGFAKMNEKLANLPAVMNKHSFSDSYYTFISGTALCLPSLFLREVGFFDELFFMYSEDVDLSLRAKKKGWKASVNNKSYLYHKEGKSTAGRKHLFYEFYTRGNFLLLLKQFGIIQILTSIPLSLIHTVLMGGFSIRNLWFTIRGIRSAFVIWNAHKIN